MAITAILLPVKFVDEQDLALRRDILRQTLGSRFPWGIEFVGSVEDFSSRSGELIQSARLARELGAQVITMHAPFAEEEDYFNNPSTNLCKPDWEFLLHLGCLAGEIGANTLTFLAQCFMRKGEIRRLTCVEKDKLMVKVGEILFDLARLSPGVRINIENTPNPFGGNTTLSSKEMVYDPLFSNVKELAYFCEIFKIGVTFNSSHWGARPGVTHAANLVKSFRLISGFVTHISLSDTSGEWVDGISVFQKGVVPGRGKMGDSLASLVRYLQRSKARRTVTLDLTDCDPKKLDESRQGLGWLMWHLDV
jgi:hypothetical protein